MKSVEISYKYDGCTGGIAFVIVNGGNTYSSPFVFESTEDAFIAACIELKK